MIDARRIYDFFVSSFYLIKRQMIVECRPTERAQLGIEKKTDRKTFYRHNIAEHLSRLSIMNRKNYSLMQQCHLRYDTQRLTDAHGIAYHPRRMYARSHQTDSVLGNKIGNAMKFLLYLHIKFLKTQSRERAPKKTPQR